jgi:AbrB family looped-hinge helix DNA binding protein
MESTLLTVGPEGQVSLPSDIRQELGLRAGAQLEARIDGSSLMLSPKATTRPVPEGLDQLDQLINELQGIFRGQPSLEDDLYAMRREDELRFEQKFGC